MGRGLRGGRGLRPDRRTGVCDRAGAVRRRRRRGEGACRGGGARWREILLRLNGKKSLILGNHDERSKFVSVGGLATVEHYAEVGKDARDGYKFVMSHYPMLDWNRAIHGSYMLHGHIHSLPPVPRPVPGAVREHGQGRYGYNEGCRERQERRFDVGVDANDYRPVNAADIVAFFAGQG